ncbi:MAG: DUF3179 domain-containing protein [Candidatus Marinimicrobia bacterium]|nr:DUF3179 domain-containing protein [Candidatus Neomarinimicrobiota bacterium]
MVSKPQDGSSDEVAEFKQNKGRGRLRLGILVLALLALTAYGAVTDSFEMPPKRAGHEAPEDRKPPTLLDFKLSHLPAAAAPHNGFDLSNATIPTGEILRGGPPRDGIPAIDEPKFLPVSKAHFLRDKDQVLGFVEKGEARAYPLRILVQHEIVNDTIEGERILVTYCPLCLTGFIFDPLVKGERVEFGTSGKLWKSNLVMYDRKTESLWSQVLGEAVLGEMTGTKLKVLPSDQMRYGTWKKFHPDGEVLSRDTGAFRTYGSSPYGDYFSVTNLSLSLVNPTDTRLPNDAFVFGIVINEKAKAYYTEAVKEKGTVEDTFEDTNIVLRYNKELEIVRMFKKLPDGQEERINPFSSFWFSWTAAHPDTELYP